jgi:fructose-1,6-bisphosphatase/inositol monophosphatase family enzyme
MKDEADGTTPAAAKQKLYAVLMAAAGTSLFEMYDFQVYGYLAAFVAEEFFPANQVGGCLYCRH